MNTSPPPSVLGAAAFVIEGMERCAYSGDAASVSALIDELGPDELRYALGMAIGFAWSGHNIVAFAQGVRLAEYMQQRRTMIAGL